MTEAQLTNTKDIRDYMFAGKAEFTLHSIPTGEHFTYKIVYHSPDPDNVPKKPLLFYLAGTNNEQDWQYACLLKQLPSFSPTYNNIIIIETNKSQGFSSPVMIAFRWFIWMLNKDKLSIDLEFMHSGKCSACGRKLTTPESIKTGLGPVCASRLSGC